MRPDNEALTDIGARMDAMPLTVMHVTAIGLCMLGFAFDLFELALGGVLGAVFSAPALGVPTSQLSLLLASVYIGAIVGAPALGYLADRVGRRLVLSGALAWLAVTSAWAAYSPDIVQLTLARGLAGIAIGAYPPLMMSYLADMLPAGRRGSAIFWACGLAGLGLPAGVFFVRSLGGAEVLGLEPWRLAVLVGAVGSAVLAACMLKLPESPRWLQARGRHAEAQAVCDRLSRSRPLLSPGLAIAPPISREASARLPSSPWPRLVPLFLLSPLATVTFPLLMGAVLTVRGFQLSDALLFVGLSNIGPTLGSLAASAVVDRVDRRWALSTCAVTLIAAGGAFVLLDSRLWLGVAAITFGIAAILYTTALSLYTTELFPAGSRAGSSALAWSFNRVGAAVSLLALVPVLRQEGAPVMFAIIAGSLMVSILLLLTSPRGRQRQAIA